MRVYVRSIARFFRCSHREAFAFLEETEVECLAVEALLSRAVRL